MGGSSNPGQHPVRGAAANVGQPLQGEAVRAVEHVRGRAIATAADLEARIIQAKPYWDHGLQVGPFCFPSSDSVNHFCFVGSPGSGKTVLIRILMQSVLPRIGETWKAAASRPATLAVPTFQIGPSSSQPPVLPPAFDFTPTKPPPVVPYQQPRSFQTPQFAPRKLKASVVILAVISGLGLLVSFLAAVSANQYSQATSSEMAGFVCLAFPFLIAGFAAWRIHVAAPRQTLPRPPPPVVPTQHPRPIPKQQTYDGPGHWDGHRALIYDAKLELLPLLAGMRLTSPIINLNPFDTRSAAWDMAADITEPATAKQIASILVPEEKNASQPFFSDAARHLLEGVMIAFIIRKPGQWTFRDVLLALKSGERLRQVLMSAEPTRDLVETYLSNERESKSILATLSTKLGPFDVVAAMWAQAENKVSLKDWVESEYILVLGNDESYRSSLDVINRAMFKRVVELLLAKAETTTGKTWFFLDEVREAGNLDGLGRLMTKGRSVGASVVLGFQDIDGLRDAFGDKQANEIVGLCGTKGILRCDSTETAKWAEAVFGEYEAIELKRSLSAGKTVTDGTTETKGTSTTDGTTDTTGSSNNWQKGDFLFASGWSDSSSSARSRSTSESESTSTNRSEADSRTDTLASDRVKRGSVLASEIQSIPKTTTSSGLRGLVASHYGAAPFLMKGFEKVLIAPDPGVPRIDYRGSDSQYLKGWTDGEWVEIVGKLPAAPSAEAAPSSSAALGEIRRVMARFLPDSNETYGIRRMDEREKS